MYKLEYTYAFFICFIVIISGFSLAYYLSDTVMIFPRITDTPASILTFKMTVFYEIFFRNFMVAVLISIVGFFTGGISVIAALFWNGVIVGSLLKSYQFSDSILQYFVYHGIFEVSAFICFGMVGLQGISFYINLFKDDICVINIHKRLLLYASVLLLIAGIIETLLISNFI